MKRVLVGAAVVAAGFMGATAQPAAACDPAMPTCYGVERWLDDRLWAIEYYVVDPALRKVDDLRDAADIECSDIC